MDDRLSDLPGFPGRGPELPPPRSRVRRWAGLLAAAGAVAAVLLVTGYGEWFLAAVALATLYGLYTFPDWAIEAAGRGGERPDD